MTQLSHLTGFLLRRDEILRESYFGALSGWSQIRHAP
jgi:hypothetical protein